jgi:hypothetical protein
MTEPTKKVPLIKGIITHDEIVSIKNGAKNILADKPYREVDHILIVNSPFFPAFRCIKGDDFQDISTDQVESIVGILEDEKPEIIVPPNPFSKHKKN